MKTVLSMTETQGRCLGKGQHSTEHNAACSSGQPKLHVPVNKRTVRGLTLCLAFVTPIHSAGRKLIVRFFQFSEEKST